MNPLPFDPPLDTRRYALVMRDGVGRYRIIVLYGNQAAARSAKEAVERRAFADPTLEQRQAEFRQLGPGPYCYTVHQLTLGPAMEDEPDV